VGQWIAWDLPSGVISLTVHPSPHPFLSTGQTRSPWKKNHHCSTPRSCCSLICLSVLKLSQETFPCHSCVLPWCSLSRKGRQVGSSNGRPFRCPRPQSGDAHAQRAWQIIQNTDSVRQADARTRGSQAHTGGSPREAQRKKPVAA
jgi:hypothetical protein